MLYKGVLMNLALQFYEGDIDRALALAKLLADIEPTYRNDVFLGLVAHKDIGNAGKIDETVTYCSAKFPTQRVMGIEGGEGWRLGSVCLWNGAMGYFNANRNGFGEVFTFDGGDGVPLKATWINDLREDYAATKSYGYKISGSVQGYSGTVNGNMVIDLDLWNDKLKGHPFDATSKDLWEDQYKDVLSPNALNSSAIYSEWNSRTNISVQGLRDRARNGYVWSHGWKDEDLVDKARELILGKSA
jgi:hypothetical protein